MGCWLHPISQSRGLLRWHSTKSFSLKALNERMQIPAFVHLSPLKLFLTSKVWCSALNRRRSRWGGPSHCQSCLYLFVWTRSHQFWHLEGRAWNLCRCTLLSVKHACSSYELLPLRVFVQWLMDWPCIVCCSYRGHTWCRASWSSICPTEDSQSGCELWFSSRILFCTCCPLSKQQRVLCAADSLNSLSPWIRIAV